MLAKHLTTTPATIDQYEAVVGKIMKTVHIGSVIMLDMVARLGKDGPVKKIGTDMVIGIESLFAQMGQLDEQNN